MTANFNDETGSDTSTRRLPLRRLLVALDFAGNSDMVLARLMLLTLADDADVSLVSVVPHDLSPPLRDQTRSDLALRLDECAARVLTAARAKGIENLTVSTQVCDGRPFEQIVRRAHEWDAELVLLGKHGRRPLLDLFLGSTAHQVITHSDVPVLIVSREAEAPYRRPLLATAFDEASVRAMVLALRAIDPLVRGGVLVHAFHAPLGALAAPTAASPERAKFDEHFRNLAEMSLNAFVAQHAQADFAWSSLLRGGDARTVIVNEVLDQRADLLALGTHARTGLGRVLLGSVAEAVTVDAPCDVLISRPSGSSAPAP